MRPDATSNYTAEWRFELRRNGEPNAEPLVRTALLMVGTEVLVDR